MSDPIHILSLGAGVQSSTLALMAAAGEVTPMPVAAIFADTQDEPHEVYRQLDFLTSRLPFSVWTVCAGHLSRDFLNAIRDPKGRCGQPPFFVRRSDAEGTPAYVGGGMLWRKCTQEYKLQPIRRKVRMIMDEAGAESVVQWIGISLDEAHRMKDSGVKYITNRYPLVELRMTRRDCLAWLNDRGFPMPPKSACVFCPYTHDSRWREMRDKRPEEWARAVAFDHALRENRVRGVNGAGIIGDIFVHRSLQPLDQVDLSTEEERGQLDMFGNECEGMCGA